MMEKILNMSPKRKRKLKVDAVGEDGGMAAT